LRPLSHVGLRARAGFDCGRDGVVTGPPTSASRGCPCVAGIDVTDAVAAADPAALALVTSFTLSLAAVPAPPADVGPEADAASHDGLRTTATRGGDSRLGLTHLDPSLRSIAGLGLSAGLVDTCTRACSSSVGVGGTVKTPPLLSSSPSPSPLSRVPPADAPLDKDGDH
jgi:hypothetical protein